VKLGIENNQESGVVDGSGASRPFFGPATEQYYDNAAWAMVPATKSNEYIPDANFFQQGRESDEPPFIKPTPNQYYLPALLTILHTVPLFRNAFLAPQVSLENYWLGEDWWKGTGSAVARTVDSASGAGSSYELDLLYEMQRLMAFLDKTDRSYVSLNSLFQLDAWRESRIFRDDFSDNDDDVLKLLRRWTLAYQRHVPDARVDGNLRSTINVGGETQNSFLLDAPVVHKENITNLHLYDVLDDSFFASQTQHAHIMDISNVLILRLDASKSGTNLDCMIPAVLYADRYMEANRGVVETMFSEREKHDEQLRNIALEVERVKFHKPRKNSSYTKPMDTLTMLKTSMKAFGPETSGKEENTQHKAVFSQLETLYKNIEHKLSSKFNLFQLLENYSLTHARPRGREEEDPDRFRRHL
jgi:hypothetical protein